MIRKPEEKQLKARAKEIDLMLKNERKANKKIFELLLLGDDKNGISRLLEQAKFHTNDIIFSSANPSFEEEDLMPKIKSMPSGVTEIKYSFKQMNLRIIEISGQKSETRKWIHAFEKVSAIVNISQYDDAEFEDDSTNKLQKSLKYFQEICSLQWFPKTPIIIFLNNIDLFQEKIKSTSIKIAFPEYQGATTFEEQIKFIEEKFLALNQNIKRGIYVVQTFSINTDLIEKMHFKVIELIIDENINPDKSF